MTTAADFDKKYDIVDEPTPLNTWMSGHYKQSFAYYTIRERLPVILTRVIDNLAKDKEELAIELGENSREEIKSVVGLLSKLKYQLQTDKQFELFCCNEPDKDLWNAFILELPEKKNTFFKACWLYAECYMYRKISSFFEATETLVNFDYFAKQKTNALEISVEVMEAVVQCTRDIESNGDMFMQLLKLNLWGNRCDLSISTGNEVRPTHGNPFDIIKAFETNLIVDNTNAIWQSIENAINCCSIVDTSSKIKCSSIIDIVCDNAGYELFTDLILAEYIIDKKLAKKVRFYVKAIPWFISDVTSKDFNWTLEYLSKHKSPHLSAVGKKWTQFIKDDKFELTDVESFWTSPYEFYHMAEVNPKLYEKLSNSQIVIFKGDLNYRKLIGDFRWDFTETFKKCLRGFQPTNLCTLRTVKADLICGLKPGQADALFKIDKNWMTTGEYGVIQFSAA